MATMSFREPNQVKWIGARPGHNGTQIVKTINTAVSAVIWTVPAAVVFYLCGFSLGIARNVNTGGRLTIRDAGDAEWATLVYVSSEVDMDGEWGGLGLTFPIEVPTLYDFYIDTAGTVKGFFYGWTE